MAELIAQDVNVWFGQRHVLKDVNLVFPEREVTALIGPSGCGKSTFIRTLNRMHELIDSAGLAGKVFLDGTDIYDAGVDPVDVRLRVGMVFQTHHLLPGFTARENVSAPLLFGGVRPAQHAVIADALLGRLGISDPTVRVDRLSVGQQQRVAIARALVGNPSVVLADEPTAALDPENAVTAVELLKDVCRECNAALLLTSHDPGLEGAFSRVVRFAELAQTSEVVG